MALLMGCGVVEQQAAMQQRAPLVGGSVDDGGFRDVVMLRAARVIGEDRDAGLRVHGHGHHTDGGAHSRALPERERRSFGLHAHGRLLSQLRHRSADQQRAVGARDELAPPPELERWLGHEHRPRAREAARSDSGRHAVPVSESSAHRGRRRPTDEGGRLRHHLERRHRYRHPPTRHAAAARSDDAAHSARQHVDRRHLQRRLRRAFVSHRA